MPTKGEREYYRMGFKDGQQSVISEGPRILPSVGKAVGAYFKESKPKRKLSAWQKFVKANSKKKIYQYASGKLKLKKMGIAYRKKKR
jgi:hypothetical protein